MSELKSCPFCGSKHWMNWHLGHLEHPWVKECLECGARGPYADTEEECTERWNRRVEGD